MDEWDGSGEQRGQVIEHGFWKDSEGGRLVLCCIQGGLRSGFC